MKSMFLSTVKYAGASLVFLWIFFIIGTKVFSAEPTLLHLDCKNQEGEKVQVSKATLVLVSGGYVDKLSLEISKNGLDLPLDASWLSNHWPKGVSRLKNMDRAYLFLKAKGYASVCSSPIHWMGTDSDRSGKNVVISFPRSKTLAVSLGQKLSLTVDFRKPGERFVKLSRGPGKPLVGATVKSYVFWSKTDDGELNGADYLGEGTSDETGRVRVTDGDFTYAIKINRQASSGNPAETVLIVKRFEDKEYPVMVKE